MSEDGRAWISFPRRHSCREQPRKSGIRGTNSQQQDKHHIFSDSG
jgi:hypothetical protein